MTQGSDKNLPIFTPLVHSTPKSLPNKEVFYFFGSPFKSKIPPFLGRDLGGTCTEEVMKKLGISEHWVVVHMGTTTTPSFIKIGWKTKKF